MDYKYTILNGNSRVYVGIGWRYRCLIGIFLTVGLLVGVFFLAHGLAKYSFHRTDNQFDKQKVLLISLDGFRYNLRDKASTPNLDWFVENGVSVDHVLNVFPTLTLPNHQSIVTGLYPEHHGILANKMYNRETKETFYLNNSQSKFWEDGTPIWIENELQGHHSGVCFWPGYNVLFKGKQATYLASKNYSSPFLQTDISKHMPYDMRVDLVIDWLKKDDVNFVALYIDEPDEFEHMLGPDPSDKEGLHKLQVIIEKVDKTIGKVMRRIKNENLASQVNVIVVGDHGQMNTNKSKVIDLQKYVNLTKDADFFGDGFIYAKPGQTERIYQKLKQAEQDEGHFEVYLKNNIPEVFHLRNHNRTGDIMYLQDPGWKLWTHNPLNLSRISRGAHGYSNAVKDMNPAFFAYGPLFRNNYKEEVINIVDLYSLMCHILQINPSTNDGQFNRIKKILKEYS